MRFGPALGVALLARLAAAQATDAAHQAPRTKVSGVVRDSIARAPLAGALVQLVGRDSLARLIRSTVSDSLGRFAFDSVIAGRYALGFFHPMLDSLGIESSAREIEVDGRRPVRADLAIPSPVMIRAAICGPRVQSASDAVVVGFVRDARDRTPLADANVTGEWLEIAIRRGGVDRHVPHLTATTGPKGWFALCNVPSPGTILIRASRGADSTDVIALDVPASGLLRRELYLGPAHPVVGIDTIAKTTVPLHAGDGHLTGVVLGAADSVPISGALVALADGPQTRSNARGEWTLSDAPAGTRVLEVRALGFYPERRPVDVLEGAEPVRVTLSSMRSVLDTVKVNAKRLTLQQAGFENRRRSAGGRYLTADDIARRHPTVTSDLFRMVPGMRLDSRTQTITVRGAVADWCVPSVYIDGLYMFTLSADEIDTFVDPNDVAGIEIYPGATAPAEFQQASNGCGSIVIWTNRETTNKPPMTKARIITGVAVAAFALLTSVLLFRH